MRTPYPSPAELKVIRAVNEFHALIPRQLQRLLYGPNSDEHAQRMLLRAERPGWLWRRKFPNYDGDGTVPFRYFLTPEGARELEAVGVPVRYLSKERKERLSRGLLYPHEIRAIDVLIAATLWARRCGREIYQRKHDRELKQELGGPVLDGFVHFRNPHTGADFKLGIEVDMGSESAETVWAAKVRRLRDLNLDLIAVAVPDEARRQLLLSHTDAGHFFFTTADPRMDPVAFIGGDHWRAPGMVEDEPLIEAEAPPA